MWQLGLHFQQAALGEEIALWIADTECLLRGERWAWAGKGNS